MLEQQEKALFGGMLLVVVLGCVASLLSAAGLPNRLWGSLARSSTWRQAISIWCCRARPQGRDRRHHDCRRGSQADGYRKARREADEAAARHALEVEAATRHQRAEAEIQAKAAEERAKKPPRSRPACFICLHPVSSGWPMAISTVSLDEGLSGDYRQIGDDFNGTVGRLRKRSLPLCSRCAEANATAEISTSTTDLSQRTGGAGRQPGTDLGLDGRFRQR